MMTALIAAVAALAGVALGRFLDVWSESRRWLREYRSVGYAAFLGSAERYLSGVLVAMGDQNFRSSAQGMELDRTFGHLQVFGSEAARIAAERVRDALLSFHALDLNETKGEMSVNSFVEQAEAAIDCYNAAIRTLRSSIRKELHVS